MANFDIEIDELKQDPAEVISQAEAGNTFSVPRNSERTSVVIKTEDFAKSRWVTADELRDALTEVGADGTGWIEQLEADQGLGLIANPREKLPALPLR